MKKGYFGAIEKLTVDNDNFRKVLYTGEHSQLVLMSIVPGGEIGSEVHEGNDQFFRFEQGAGKVIINETEYAVKDGDAIIVPTGATHNVINTSATEALKLYTIYSPAHHQDGVVRATKAEAEANGPEFDGKTTE
jgi:mannose-6-phosphate isomerase-like protein (cupin superfamily)